MMAGRGSATYRRDVTGAIVPRWEWRVFADDFGEADRRFDAAVPHAVHDSDETYVIAPVGDASVKVRDGLVDVKVRVATDGDGLEQWKPILKAPYPLSAPEVATVLAALCVPVPAPARDEYTRAQIVDEVLGPHGELVAVRVHKRRAHYTFGGCLAERSEIRTVLGDRRTIAVESEDPGRVAATVRELGCDPRRNVSLPRELKLLAGVGPGSVRA
jgi:exopolyphosphatase / guanosine-5'-triphosphate,3'-diphosphate pyrophosphatase